MLESQFEMSDAQSKKKRSGINWAKLQNTPQLICISLNNNNPYCNLTPSSKMQPRGNSSGEILTGILQLLHKLCSFVGWEKLIISVSFMKDLRQDYVLIDWVGGLDGKIFDLRSWRTDWAQRGPCAMTEGQIFSRPARPNSVNKHFIIWAPCFSSFLFYYFLFFSGNKICYQNVHSRRSFWPKSWDWNSNKVSSHLAKSRTRS